MVLLYIRKERGMSKIVQAVEDFRFRISSLVDSGDMSDLAFEIFGKNMSLQTVNIISKIQRARVEEIVGDANYQPNF
tara:strand:- start:280 stop:510 length:231 start_codon:yes stop_codon:yes gene_type:complete